MAFCFNCGTSLKEGAVFCHECGSRFEAAQQPMQSASQPTQVSPPAQAPGFVPPPAPPMAPPPTMGYQQAPPPVQQQPYIPPVQQQGNGKVTFEVVPKEMLRLVMVKLENSAFRYESGAMYYMKGQLVIESNLPSAGGFLKSMVTKEAAVKPVIRGTGTVFLEPSFGEFTILDLKGEEWILDKGAYYASEMGIEVGMWTNKAISGFFSGEGFFQTKVGGYGKVIVVSNGPLEEVILDGSFNLVVDGTFAIARTSGVNLSVAKASKGLFSSMISGEGLVNTFSGVGKVMIAPVANRDVTLMNYLGTIHTAVKSIRNSGS
jgi:uncharacterized protein (AIM24 family)